MYLERQKLAFIKNQIATNFIILKIEVSPRQPLGTPNFQTQKKCPKSEQNEPHGWLRA